MSIAFFKQCADETPGAVCVETKDAERHLSPPTVAKIMDLIEAEMPVGTTSFRAVIEVMGWAKHGAMYENPSMRETEEGGD